MKSKYVYPRFVFLAAAGVALALMGSSSVRAQNKTDRGQLSSRDYKFVCDASEANMMEVSLGKLASDKAADPSVRDFGKRMAAEHQKANDELNTFVAKKGATLTEADTKKDAKETDRLNKLSGTDFDRAYVKMMVDDHKKVVKEFQDESTKGDDAELKAWVNKVLPALEDHLHTAQGLETTLASAK